MRLVTRGDLDGLTCAVLISLHERIDDLALIHPQDITDDKFEIREGDIVANLPYHPNAAMWFDHHHHTATPAAPPRGFAGSFGAAPSAARLVYEFYGGEEELPQYAELVHETDRLDSADLAPGDVTDPQGYIRLGFTIDGRTGIGAFESYFKTLVKLLRQGTPIAEILAHPEVERRCRLLDSERESFATTLRETSRLEGNVVVTDFRDLLRQPVGNRFLIYTLFPQANVSLRLQWGPDREFTMITLGHSLFDRSCKTNVGELAARYGGGGHAGAASIPVHDEADALVELIVAELRRNG